MLVPWSRLCLLLLRGTQKDVEEKCQTMIDENGRVREREQFSEQNGAEGAQAF